MKARAVLLITGLVLASALSVSAPASAAPLDKGHFHDVFSETYDCVTPEVHVRQDGDVHGNFTFNLRGGPNVFPYYRESVSGTVVNTNLDTEGTYTNVFTLNSRDLKIVDNGDGTITIFGQNSGSSRWYDTDGRLVLKDTGNIRFAVDIDYNGTPGNADDDEEVAGSFRIIHDSTGHNDTTGRDFCEDLLEFTPES